MDETELSGETLTIQVVTKLSVNSSANFLVNRNPSSGKLYTASSIKWRPTVAVIGLCPITDTDS